MVDWIAINSKQKKELLNIINSIINLACIVCLDDGWTKNQLELVRNEFCILKKDIEKDRVCFKYGKKQRMLDSTYILTESLEPLSQTELGCKILLFQEHYDKIK